MTHLYFICPTDHLEPILESRPDQENYYLTSLGNSMSFQGDVIDQIQELIWVENVSNISFILSDNNQILAGLGNRKIAETESLHLLIDQFAKRNTHLDQIWAPRYKTSLLISYHLNDKIKELRSHLKNVPLDALSISGKMYNQRKASFSDIYSDLICNTHILAN